MSAGSLSPAEQKASSDDIVLLRQRVAELEQILRESKNDVNAPVNGEETGLFLSRETLLKCQLKSCFII